MSFQAGVCYFDGREVPESDVLAILDQVAGENSGFPECYLDPGVMLAHSGLPLAGRAGGHGRLYSVTGQPITFDGRLHNRSDLLLRLGNAVEREAGDAALALAVFERWGADGLAYLIGDWSLAIWNAPRKALVLASDFAGVRPLYYCVQRDRVLWATRLARLVRWTGAAEIDDTFVAGFLKFGGCPHRTPYRDIFSVPPGHAVQISQGCLVPRSFWKLPVDDRIRYQRETAYEEHLRALFREAVESRLSGDGRVLCELSGGMDSSSIVCMASHLLGQSERIPTRLATVSYEHTGSRDDPFRTAVEQHCGIEGIHVPAAAYPFLVKGHTGGAIPAFWEELHADTAKLVDQIGAKTYMTGLVGDLTMGNWWDDSEQITGLLRRGRLLAALQESLAWSKVLQIPIYPVLWKASRLSFSSTAASRDSSDTGGRDTSIAPSLRARTGLSDPSELFSRTWTQAPPERWKHFRALDETLELRKLQPPEPLQHLAYTHPFGHRPLVEFMFAIPSEIVCRPGEPRRLMRRAFQGLWPEALRRRRSKDSFGEVFLDSLQPIANELLQQPRLQVVERGYVEPVSFRRRLEKLSHSLECNEPQLRQIMLLELWLRGREEPDTTPEPPTSPQARSRTAAGRGTP